MKKPVGIPLSAWFTVWMNDNQLTGVYYDALDIDPYIETLEKQNESLNLSVKNYHKSYKWHEQRASELDQAIKNMRQEKHKAIMKLEAIQKENNILRMYEVDRSTKRQHLEAIRDITNQTGTAMTRLIKIREVLGDE